MSRFAWLPLFLAVPVLGCSVSAAELSPSSIALNQCDDDNGCSGGRCVDNVCRGTDGALKSLLVSVTPPVTAPGLESLTYYRSYPDAMNPIDADGGPLNLAVPSPVAVLGNVTIDTPDCDPVFVLPNGSSPPSEAIPPEVTFTPSERVLGITGATYTALLLDDFYRFRANLPPANYDVYVRPKYDQIPGMDGSICPVPPRLILNQPVSASSFDIKLPAASKLEIGITWPIRRDELGQILPDPPLTGWTVDLIDSSSGRALSTTAVVGAPEVMGQTTATYRTSIDYAPMYALDKGDLKPARVGTEVIRLTPPATIIDPATSLDPEPVVLPYTAPVLLAQLEAALAPDVPDSPAQVLLAKQLPAAVDVEFQSLLAGDEKTSVAAGVTLTAMAIDGVVGISTSFSRTVQVAAGKTATVSLLPGRYRVEGSPNTGCDKDGCLGMSTSEWIVAAEPHFQAGRVVQFSRADQLAGQAFVANGDKPAVGATVRAIASASIFDANVMNAGDARSSNLPRASGGLVGSDGWFSFDADRGTFDLRIEPDMSTGFGWLVKPGVSVPMTEDSLSPLVVPLPIVYRGVVSVNGEGSGSATPIPGALIRAYVYMKDGELVTKPSEGVVAVQVAETHADASGGFTLLIPANLGGS